MREQMKEKIREEERAARKQQQQEEEEALARDIYFHFRTFNLPLDFIFQKKYLPCLDF